MAKTLKSQTEFVLCINNSEDDLQKGKMYKVIPDESATKSKYIRVIDDSGEDYLYPSAYFIKIELPQEAKRVLLRAS
jgi:hypothetical protein